MDRFPSPTKIRKPPFENYPIVFACERVLQVSFCLTNNSIEGGAAPPGRIAVAWPLFIRRHREMSICLLIWLACMAVYNANGRLIAAGDTYGARYLPFSLWRHHTVILDPIVELVAQGRPYLRQTAKMRAYWITGTRDGRAMSLYPVTTPVLVAPLYLPAVAYLHLTGWAPLRLDRIARVMEKLSASLLAATSAVVVYLLLRRRTGARTALLLTLVYAFGTNTWMISSQALWQHGSAQLLIALTLWLVTGPCTKRTAAAAGLCTGLIACARPPDVFLALPLGCYALWWARREAPVLIGSALVPMSLLMAYNLGVAGRWLGGYGVWSAWKAFQGDGRLSGMAGLLFSPTRGLFVYSPFLLTLLFCLPALLRDRQYRGLAAAIGSAVVLQVAFYGGTDWRQGFSWGPRWLTDMLPMLFWLLPPAIAVLGSLGRVAFGAACVAAVALQVIGAFWYTGAYDNAIFAAAPQNGGMRAAWAIRNAAFLNELRHPRVGPDLGLNLRGNIDNMQFRADLDSSGRRAETLLVEGWTLAGARPPAFVHLLLDGLPVAGTNTFLKRPDVDRALNTAVPSGWRIEFPTRDVGPGDHLLAVLVQAKPNGDLCLLGQRRLTFDAGGTLQATKPGSVPDRAAAAIASAQQRSGAWHTRFTPSARFDASQEELNVYTTAVMVDLLSPVARQAGLQANLERARNFLTSQIEPDGLVRYHGLPNAPTIGTLGCAITPDADDTALIWRIAPSPRTELLPGVLRTLREFRTPQGLYRTWLSPKEQYHCINPGADPNPADIGIQMHVLLFLSKADRPAARALCAALQRSANDDRVWVYYKRAPLMVILRQADLREAGCPVALASSRQQAPVPGQEPWISAARMLDQARNPSAPPLNAAELHQWLQTTAADDFSLVRRTPPLLYHNDLTASVSRFYWSQEFGYALWLRLYFGHLLTVAPQ